ncbi:GxxExxY protein [Flavobacterium sp.]|jgi:GxxExxY protein|uniref:GxxExxY protein n=1 Tax=Flavobacterium sp. TaxID=239 RepID=UPI0037BF06C0
MELTKTYLKDLVYHVNGAAIEVHKNLGPGLLESIYHKCLEKELSIKDFKFKTELIIPINYKGLEIDANLRCDLFVENCLLVELKSVEKILPIHEAQLLTYMKLLKIPMGLMINFNVTNIYKEGQKTYINEIYRVLEE